MYKHQKIFVFLLLLSSIESVRIKFYDSLNFKGLFHEVEGIITDCTALPVYGHGKTVSIITDTCITLHQSTTCSSVNSIKLARGNHTNLTGRGFGSTFNGFMPCTESEGGEKLNVDLFYTTDLANLAVKYNDVCGCIDMPAYVGSNQILSINNHGNCVKLYERAGCDTAGGKVIELPGGSNAKTRNLGLYFGVPTRSISSCDDHSACLQLEAKVYKFQIMSSLTKADVKSNSLDFELASKSTFRNNGSAIVTQEYVASKEIIESIEIVRSKSFTEMTRVETEKETEWISDVGISYGPFSASSNLRKTFREAHTMERNSSYQESEKFFSEEKRSFSVSQTISINPCTIYEVSSVVKFMENYPVDYIVHARVSGTFAGVQLNTTELQNRLTTMQYVEDDGDFTIIANATGRMIANFGVETLIDGEGMPIEGCNV